MQKLTHWLHEHISRHLLLPVWRAQRHIRPSRRAVAAAIVEGLRTRRAAASWSYDQKSNWILDRLRFTARRAYRETAYYRNLFDEIGFEPLSSFTFEDFACLPVLDRDTVRDAGMSLVSDAVPRIQMHKDATGGSTGAPTEVWIGPAEMGWKESSGEYFMGRIGAPTGVSTALLWGHHLDPTGKDGWRERYHAFETNSRWFDCLRLSSEVLERYHREFDRWQPECIIGYASAVGHLAEHVLDRGHRPTYPRRCFVTGAEKLLPQHREAIQAAFGRPVHERYGGRDVGYVAFQMEPQRTNIYEVDWANILIEPETGGLESSILITKLHADAMPMIRYRVGDIARFLPGSKPGHPAFFLNEVVGRDVDRIWLPDGRWITGLQIPHMMKDYPVREYMFLQRPDFSVEIRIAPKPGFTCDANERILSTVRANLPGLNITTLLVDEIPRTSANKWRPVVSEVDISRGHAA
jgi:phenylacetate-CoA ligase